MATAAEPVRPAVCADCGADVVLALLACPSCHHLVHSSELKALADEADRAAAGGEKSRALAAWRRALELLPPASLQHAVVTARLGDLSRELDAARHRAAPAGPRPGTRWAKVVGSLGVLGLLVWKLKFVFAFLLTKGKLLLLGLTNSGTLFSMLLSLGVYWSAWGWAFALGLLLSMYVHEMGHVFALQRLGIRASAPMFIPGLGAVVRMKQYPADPREDARVGLAGPLWGAGAALTAYAAGLATGSPLLAAVARSGAWLNLLNLLPVWQLDGGRGFRALGRSQRWIAAAGLAVMWAVTAESLLFLILIAATVRAFGRGATAPDRTALVHYVGLVVLLSTLLLIPVRLP